MPAYPYNLDSDCPSPPPTHKHTQTDARKNTDLKGKLNIDKWSGPAKENVAQ